MSAPLPDKLSKTLLIIIFIFVLGYVYLIVEYVPISLPSFPVSPGISKFKPEIEGVEKFSSVEDFKNYLEEAELEYMGGLVGLGGARVEVPMVEEMGMPGALEIEGKGAIPERVSETTVQVKGIDEPDIVKTDGKEVYFSQSGGYTPILWRRAIPEIIPPPKTGETKVIKAFPPADLAIDSKIEEKGDLLLYKDKLIIFSGREVLGYDVSSPENPKKEWTLELNEKNYILGARLYKDKVYLITKTIINVYRPCPIQPLSVKGVPLEIKCAEIYHPVGKIPVDVTYTAIILEPSSGEVKNTVSFVGSSGSSVVYMSENGIYVTYTFYESIIKFFSSFLKEKCQDIVPNWVIEKIEKLQDYDISEAAKMTEFQIIWERFTSSLGSDERLKIENEIQNRMTDYYKEHKRDLEITGIVKIGLDEFEVTATGNVPGRPLNQFSLDEYETYLRMATTVGEGMFWWGIGGTTESANDVYVLNENLKIVGSVRDLGLEERIYSVRFIQDKGYIVTFRQIDPFFVLDLSDPEKPELKGELKIPGYSSYLHSISKDEILGIGKEGSKVKISLFNVSRPEEPIETDKYTLDEYWSDILDTHHAFLLDVKHKVFFLPGRRGGYIFSYADSQLKLVRAVSDIWARRAIYINDYLYIIGDDKVVVLNEIDWEKINTLEF